MTNTWYNKEKSERRRNAGWASMEGKDSLLQILESHCPKQGHIHDYLLKPIDL